MTPFEPLSASESSGPPALSLSPPRGPAFRRAQRVALALLTSSYVALYFCRTDLTVDGPLLDRDEGGPLDGERELGSLITAGTVMYGLGKLCSGPASSVLGARRVIAVAMGGSAAFSVLLVLVPRLWWMMLWWAASRLVSALQWVTLVVVAREWFEPSQTGVAVGVLSLSWTAGDSLARVALGGLIKAGAGWQAVFVAAAAVTLAACAAVLCMLKVRPQEAGFAPLPHTLGDGRTEAAPKAPVREVVALVAARGDFWLACGLNVGTNFSREVLRDWCPKLLHDRTSASPGAAGIYSLAFPLGGAVGAVLAGVMADRHPLNHRGPAMLKLMSVGVASLALLYVVVGLSDEPSAALVTLLIFMLGIGAFGPYATLSSVSIDLCQSAERTTPGATGVYQGGQDAAGYGAAAVSGVLIGSLVEESGWGAALLVLLVVSTLTLGALGAFWRMEPALRLQHGAGRGGGVGGVAEVEMEDDFGGGDDGQEDAAAQQEDGEGDDEQLLKDK